MRVSYERRTLGHYADKKQTQINMTRNTDKPRRKGLCTTSSIHSNIPLPFTTTAETFPISSLSNNNKLTSRTKVIFPTKNISKWSQIVNNNGTFAHSISNLLEKTKNKLSLKELSPSGQIHFVNMMNRDLTLMQTIELYTALTPNKFTLAYRLNFNVQPNGVYINFAMSQPNSSVNAQTPHPSVNNNLTTNNAPTTSETVESSSSSVPPPPPTLNFSSQQYPTMNDDQQSNNTQQSIARHGWALFQISREKDSNNAVLPNKIIEVAILM